MIWFKRVLVLLGLLLALAVAVPFFFTFNGYIPIIEDSISIKLKEPVSIKSIRFASLPTPHISVDGILIGTSEDIILGKVVVAPDFFSLLQSHIVIKSIEIYSPVITQKGIDKLLESSKLVNAPSQQQPAQYRIESIRLINALINFDKKSFGPFDARINLDSNGKLEHASISTPDDTLNISIKPEQSNYLINASAKKWTLPIGPPIELDELSLTGVATTKDVELSQIICKLYGGTANGKILFSWQDKFKLSGNLNINQVELQKIALILSSKTHIGGKLDARPVFSASAGSVDKMMNALHLETPFNVKNGVLYGIDIQKAATNMIKKDSSGGVTRFDQLSGHLVMAHSAYSFTQLKIASGTLAVEGNVNISPKKVLSGRINAKVKAAGISTTVPLNVAGSVDSPLLYPTGATIAGAAIGTAMMGPGVGTSVGAKVGGWVEKLFDNKKDQK